MQSSDTVISYLSEAARPTGEEVGAAVGWIGGMLAPGAADRLPFSFTLDGRASAEFLGDWAARDLPSEIDRGPNARTTRRAYHEPSGGIEMVLDLVSWTDFPAAEWVLKFSNTGGQDSAALADMCALDLTLPTAGDQPTVLHAVHPDYTNERAYLPYDEEVASGAGVELAAMAGRSSSGAFPFFTVAHGDKVWVVAVGWSGRWRATIERDGEGGARIRVALGKFAARLHPGERVRSPRVLVMACGGDVDRAHNIFRALMLAHYVPRDSRGAILMPPFAAQNYDIYVRARPDWATEAGQVSFVRDYVAGLGLDTHWFDAAWFPRAFPGGVGSWSADPERFPNGLRPVSDEAHKHGMRFLLWFETGRVAPESEIANEHPELVLMAPNEPPSWHKGCGLFDYGNPEALAWITDRVLQLIDDWGIDSYREDFNFEPGIFWDECDETDRVGVCENRWVQGFYAFWDALRSKIPDLFIDNCAGGGHRIDLETCMRSIPLWRSDTGCGPGNSDGDQIQSAGLGRYVPLNTVGCHSPLPYDVRSTATAGLIAQWDLYADGFDRELAKASVDEAKRLHEYWLGEMHLLIPESPDGSRWHALQLHREDLASGIVLVFRRAGSPYVRAVLQPRCLRVDAKYELTFIDEKRHERTLEVAGADLAGDGLAIEMPDPRSSMIVHYRPVGA